MRCLGAAPCLPFKPLPYIQTIYIFLKGMETEEGRKEFMILGVPSAPGHGTREIPNRGSYKDRRREEAYGRVEIGSQRVPRACCYHGHALQLSTQLILRQPAATAPVPSNGFKLPAILNMGSRHTCHSTFALIRSPPTNVKIASFVELPLRNCCPSTRFRQA